MAYWSQSRIRELSGRYPGLVAHAVADRTDYLDAGEFSNRSYREFLGSQLSPTARNECFRLLELQTATLN